MLPSNIPVPYATTNADTPASMDDLSSLLTAYKMTLE